MRITCSVRKVFEKAGVDLRSFDSYYVVDGYLCGQSSYRIKGPQARNQEYGFGPWVKICKISDQEIELIDRLVEADDKEAERLRQERIAKEKARQEALASIPSEVQFGEDKFFIKNGEVLDSYGNFLFKIHGVPTLRTIHKELMSFLEDMEFIGD